MKRGDLWFVASQVWFAASLCTEPVPFKVACVMMGLAYLIAGFGDRDHDNA